MFTVQEIKALSKPGKHADANGLYLNITKAGTKSWIFRYQIHGRRREMGLGSIDHVSLKKARELAADARKLHSQGIDPKSHRDSQAHIPENNEVWTFDRCAGAYIEAHKPKWQNAKHISQWTNTLKQYASPVIGHLPVNKIDTGLILQTLEPVWRNKTETATRVRQRIESVLSWAIVMGHRDGPNPAVWKGNLEFLLPPRSKIQAVKHHAALPYADAPEFMQKLRAKISLSAKALQLTILTAMRTSEVLGAEWKEFDLENDIWTVPAKRMKKRRVHRVPLSEQAIALLASIDKEVGNDWVFPSRNNKPLSNMSMLVFIKKQMSYPDLTVHGFRSTFRDWAAEVSHYPRELAESALAHVLSNQTEAAYQRGDLLEKRREMMQEWADYINAA